MALEIRPLTRVASRARAAARAALAPPLTARAKMQGWLTRFFEPSQGDDGRAAWPAYALFVGVLVLYPLHQLMANGRVLREGQLWAELVYYYDVATQLPVTEQLVAPDAGYVPLPQRVLAAIGPPLGVTTAGTPYYYSVVAILGAALLVGVVCLPVFRALVRNDVLRFAIAMSILLVPDFNTKAFTSFTYFAVVLVLAVTALAAVTRDREVPAWSWVIVPLMASKPLLLTLFPLIAVVGLLSGRRFRRIAVGSLLAVVFEAWSLMNNPTVGGLSPDAQVGDLLLLALRYSLGYTGRYAVSPLDPPSAGTLQVVGGLVCLIALAVVVTLRGRGAVLVVAGLYLVGVTMLLNAFSFAWLWFTPDLAALTAPFPLATERWLFGAEVGVILLVGGVVATVLESDLVRGRLAGRGVLRTVVAPLLAVVAFVGWFAGAGWPDRVVEANAAPGIPLTDVSQWQQQAAALDSDDSVVCVPVNSAWLYGRNCTTLYGPPVPDPTDVWITGYADVPPGPSGRPGPFQIQVPDFVTASTVASFGLMVRSPSGAGTVTAEATVTMTDGSQAVFSARADLPAGGALMQFNASPVPQLTGVRALSVSFSEPVQVARGSTSWGSTSTSALVLWMGMPPA